MSNTPHSSYRLSPEVRKLLAAIADRTGETKTAVLERLIGDAWAGMSASERSAKPKRRAAVRTKNREAK